MVQRVMIVSKKDMKNELDRNKKLKISNISSSCKRKFSFFMYKFRKIQCFGYYIIKLNKNSIKKLLFICKNEQCKIHFQ